MNDSRLYTLHTSCFNSFENIICLRYRMLLLYSKSVLLRVFTIQTGFTIFPCSRGGLRQNISRVVENFHLYWSGAGETASALIYVLSVSTT